MLSYKGYEGHVTFDDEAGLFHGEVVDTRDVITFQGRSVEELETAFRDSIDDYLEWCAERGKTPDKPFSGRFVVRVSPAVHRRLVTEASRAGKSLNTWVVERLVETPPPQIIRIAARGATAGRFVTRARRAATKGGTHRRADKQGTGQARGPRRTPPER